MTLLQIMGIVVIEGFHNRSILVVMSDKVEKMV
jgi:hypothetical protein